MKNKKNDLDNPEAGLKNQLSKKSKNFWIWMAMWIIILIAIVIFVVICIVTNKKELLYIVFYTFLIDNVLAVPSLLIGIIIFLGYLLQKKSLGETLSGTFKGVVGYIVLQMGSAFLTGVSKPLLVVFGELMKTKVVILDTYVSWSEINTALGKAATIVSYTVLLGLSFNILLVALKKITNIRSINVTGHIMFQQASVVVAVMYFFIFKDFSEKEGVRQLLSIITSGIMLGAYWGVFSNLAYAPTQDLTNNAGFSIGHQQMFGVWAAYNLGKLFSRKGKSIKSIEELNLKKGFRIFHDNIFTSSLLMFLFFGLLFLLIKVNGKWEEVIKKIGDYNLFKGKIWFIQLLGFVFTIVASLQILMIGARMFVAELQKSFIGISGKLIPGAVVGIDIAGTFSYGEKSVTFGFIAGAIGNFIGMGIVILLGQVLNISIFKVIVMVGFIPMFFDNAALGLYANKTGGWKACLTIPFIFGILVVFGALFIVKIGGRTGEIFQMGYNGLFDWTTIWSIFLGIIILLPPNVAMFMPILFVIILMIIGLLTTTEPGKPTRFKNLFIKKRIQKIKENPIDNKEIVIQKQIQENESVNNEINNLNDNNSDKKI